VSLAAREVAPEAMAAIRLVRVLEPCPALRVERERVALALARIIQNAYEATPPGGTIALRARAADGEGCELSVYNTGPAIDPAVRERMFDPFFTTRDRATGLGLTLASQIVQQNGGAIRVTNEADGVAFTLAFGAARALPAGGGAA
jgi:signal transduction histidine kinase